MGEVYKARDTRLDRDVALKVKNAGGATPERLLFESAEDKSANAFSPDGKLLVFSAGSNLSRQIWALPLAGEAKPYRVFPDERESHHSARFSPDGTWLAYSAGNPSSVFVQAFPATEYREQIFRHIRRQPKVDGGWAADCV
jgi:Tol biopolymer transport system component